MNRIKILREEFGYTQQELADKLDGAKSTIAMYENETRKPSLEVLIKLSEIFNCSIDYILCKSNVRNHEEIKNVQFANAGGLDVNGLDYEDLLELRKENQALLFDVLEEIDKNDLSSIHVDYEKLGKNRMQEENNIREEINIVEEYKLGLVRPYS